MLDLSAQPTEQDNDLIPQNQLAWAILKLREIKTSSDTGTRYLDMELTIDEGQPYAKRKIWINIMDPLAAQNSEGAKNMGLMMLRRIMEAAMGATPDNPQSYQQLQDYTQLNGMRVPVKITVKKEKDPRYDDKNQVEFLSPHSSVKSVVKAYDALVHEGVNNLSELKDDAPQQGGAGMPPAQPQGGFGNPPAGSPPQGQPPQQQPAQQPAQQQPVQQAMNTPPQQQTGTPPQSQQWLDQQGQQQQQPQQQGGFTPQNVDPETGAPF